MMDDLIVMGIRHDQNLRMKGDSTEELPGYAYVAAGRCDHIGNRNGGG